LVDGNIKREVVTLIRLGEALKYNKKHYEALEYFDKALNKFKEDKINNHLDFAFQHIGKCLMELGRLDEAEKNFIEAYKLRELKGDTSLIKSTKQALCLVKRLKSNNSLLN